MYECSFVNTRTASLREPRDNQNMSDENTGSAGLEIPASVGRALRERRTAAGLSIRELAAEAGVSASLVSQIERGKINPSVARVLSLVTALGISLDELFVDLDGAGATHASADEETGGVLHADERRRIDLATGVEWQRLTPDHEQGVDFLYVVYEVGGASCPPGTLMHHHGREYGLILSGHLGATVGPDHFELEPGDSIVFNSEIPHRLWTIGDEPAVGVWTIIGRNGDRRDPVIRPAARERHSA
jgi:transcriptional regulator with XRE-family HTH domain